MKCISENFVLTLSYNFQAGIELWFNLITCTPNIQAFLFNLSKIKQMRSNLPSKFVYKEICYDLHLDLVQSHSTPLTQKTYPPPQASETYGSDIAAQI